MLRLARSRRAADDGEIALRVGAPSGAVRTAMRRLERAGLVEVQRGGRGGRLTMAGLALALALVPAPAPKRKRADFSSRAA
jgi:Mn-dependent DtxR family transcriptional regulator